MTPQRAIAEGVGELAFSVNKQIACRCHSSPTARVSISALRCQRFMSTLGKEKLPVIGSDTSTMSRLCRSRMIKLQVSRSFCSIVDKVASVLSSRFCIHNQPIPSENCEEFLDVMLNHRSIDTIMAADIVGEIRFRRALFDEFEDSRPDRVQVEYLALTDVKHYCAVSSVGTADGIGNFVHQNNSSRDRVCAL